MCEDVYRTLVTVLAAIHGTRGPGRVHEHGSVALGFANLKPEQHRAIVELVRGRDTFVSLPTGYGKSLIYQVLPACAKDIILRTAGQVSDAFHPVVFV